MNMDDRARVIFNRKLESAESNYACLLSLKIHAVRGPCKDDGGLVLVILVVTP